MLKRPESSLAPVRGRSVRFRLLAIALLPTLVIFPFLLGVAVIRWNEKFNAMLISKVNGDLTIAHQYLARILEYTDEHIRALGLSAGFRNVISTEEHRGLTQLLEDSREALGLDFLYLADSGGRVVASAPRFISSSIRTSWPVVASALKGSPSSAIDIFTNEELGDIAPGLASRARLELVPTPNAVPTDRQTETRGMVIHSASPVSFGGDRQGALVGGLVLNQNLRFHRHDQRLGLSRRQPS